MGKKKKPLSEKYKSFFFRLNNLPSCGKDEYYSWADYVELRCFTNKDGMYSVKEFIDEARPRAEDLGQGDFEDTRLDKIKKRSKSELNDKWERRASNIFKIIEHRVNVFGDYYPFTLSSSGKVLELKYVNFLKHNLYLYLLFCANQPYTDDFGNELTSGFEVIGLNVIKQLLPPHGEARLFGSSNIESDTSKEVGSTLWKKLEFIRDFLFEDLKVTKQDIGKYDKGDRGLDIIAKVPVFDGESHFPTYFAQCSCSAKDWVDKQYNTHHESWSNLVIFRLRPKRYMIIPQAYRDATGQWHDRTKIYQNVLIDRQRIVKALSLVNDLNFLEKLNSYSIIKDFNNYKDPVF